MIVTAAGGLENWKSKHKAQNHDNQNTSIATNEGEEDKVKEVKDKETKSKKKNTVSETFVRIVNLCSSASIVTYGLRYRFIGTQHKPVVF